MKRYGCITLIMLLTACGPTLQTNIFANSVADMQKVDSECANTVAHEKSKHVAAINCRFDSYEVILGERGFQEYNDLDTLKKHFLYIAKQQDAHKLTDEKSSALFEKYTEAFYTALQQHDNTKSRVNEAQNAQTWAVIGAIASGLGNGLQAYSAARYPVNSPAYQPASCPACDVGIAQGQQMVNQAQAEQQQREQQQQTEALQQQAQQQQNEINRLNGRSPAEKLRDCAQAGNCAGAFAAPYPQDSYGSYGSVPAGR